MSDEFFTEIRKGGAAEATLVEIRFPGGTEYYTSASFDIPGSDGNTYVAGSNFKGFDIDQSQENRGPAGFTLSFAGKDDRFVENARIACFIHFAARKSDGTFTPMYLRRFRGRTKEVRSALLGSELITSVRCTNSLVRLDLANPFLMTPDAQRVRSAEDTAYKSMHVVRDLGWGE